ncbi:MAG: ABC transporter substrate-binding protein [Bacteroidetes bacterium]|nr:ABC transporter substrate-binding protein [Bacteroidota bacterium]
MPSITIQEPHRLLFQTMMSTRLDTFIFLLTAWVVAQPSVLARQADESRNIRTMLESREAAIKKILGTDTTLSEAQMSALRSAVNDMFDFGSMGQAALGRHWDELSAQQRTKFVDTFAGIVRHQSLADVDIYRARVVYETVTVSGNEAQVVTTTTYKDVPTKVVYTLRRAGSEWRATDVILDEVSTVEGYSRSFQSYIRKRGFDALMDNLTKRLASTKEG